MSVAALPQVLVLRVTTAHMALQARGISVNALVSAVWARGAASAARRRAVVGRCIVILVSIRRQFPRILVNGVEKSQEKR